MSTLEAVYLTSKATRKPFTTYYAYFTKLLACAQAKRKRKRKKTRQ